jgi:nitrate/nitrite transporter NarK
MGKLSEILPFIGKKLPLTKVNSRQDGAMRALLIISCLIAVNFMVQMMISSVKVLIQADLKLTDAQTSLPTSATVSVYGYMKYLARVNGF